MPIVYLRVSIVVILLLITGCAGQVKMLDTLTPETVVKDNEGIVVARVINASAYSLPFNQLTITPENFNESSAVKLERLQAIRSRMQGTTVFSSPVQAGTYALSSIRAFHSNGNYWYSRFVGADAKFGVFTVSPNAVTDLGTLVYYPKSQDDKYINMLLRVPDVEHGEVLNKYFPFLKVDDKPFVSWNDDDRDDERASNFASVAQNPVSYDKRYLAPDNTLYFLTKLGVIIIRTAEGEWTMDAVDTNLELTTIAQNERGDVVVGGGEGTLFWKSVGGEWINISLDTDYKIEKVLFNNPNTIDVIAAQKTKLSILRANIDDESFEWQVLNHYNSIDGWRSIPKSESEKIISATKKPPTPKVIMGVSLLELGGETLITVRQMSEYYDPVFRQPSSKIYRYKPAGWEVQRLYKEPDISAVVNAGKVKFGIKRAGFWSWDGKPDYLRYDTSTDSWVEMATSVNRCRDGQIIREKTCPDITASDTSVEGGKNKKKTGAKLVEKSRKKSFTFRSVPVFHSDMDGIAIVTFSDFNAWSGNRKTEVKILVTDDGGKTWLPSEHSLPHDYCGSTVPEVTDRFLVSCNGSSGDFYESFDQGKTWEHVRQHENF